MDDYISHYGVKRRSGRYAWGSGDNPYQGDGEQLSGVARSLAKSDTKKAAELLGIANKKMSSAIADFESSKRNVGSGSDGGKNKGPSGGALESPKGANKNPGGGGNGLEPPEEGKNKGPSGGALEPPEDGEKNKEKTGGDLDGIKKSRNAKLILGIILGPIAKVLPSLSRSRQNSIANKMEDIFNRKITKRFVKKG